jgi:hypothetical protein
MFPSSTRTSRSAIDRLQNQVNGGQTADQTPAQFQAVTRLAQGKQWFAEIQGFEKQATDFCNAVLGTAGAGSSGSTA